MVKLDGLARLVVKLLPYRVRYWTVIMAAAKATTGPYSHEEAPGVTITKILQRM